MNTSIFTSLIGLIIVCVVSTTSNAQYKKSDKSYQEKDKNYGEKESYSSKAPKLKYKIAGEIYYNNVVKDKDDANLKGELDFYKFAIKTSYNFTKKISITSKEISEHTFDPNYDYGDVYVSNVYVKYKHSKKIAVQTGMVSVPISGGKTDVYGSVELSPLEKYFSYPWRELGIGISGSFRYNLNYRITLSTGLDPYELDSKTVIYAARNNKFSSSLKNLATGMQVYFDNKSTTRFGFSAIYSSLEQSAETSKTFTGASYSFTEVFGVFNIGDVQTRIVGLLSSVNESDKIIEKFYNKVGSKQIGALFEVSYDFSALLNKEKYKLLVMLRSEYYDSHFRTQGIKDYKKYEHYDYTLGIVFVPLKNVEFKADYKIQNFDKDYSTRLFNIGIAFQL